MWLKLMKVGKQPLIHLHLLHRQALNNQLLPAGKQIVMFHPEAFLNNRKKLPQRQLRHILKTRSSSLQRTHCLIGHLNKAIVGGVKGLDI